MATERDLKNASRSSLTPFMISRGYTEGTGCSFYKVAGDGVYHVLQVVPIFSGRQARVWINCTVPELVDGFGSQPFPPDGMTIQLGGYMSAKGIGFDFGRSLIDTDARRQAFTESLVNIFEAHAFPFFDRIQSRAQLWDAFSDDQKAHYEDHGLKNLILSGGKSTGAVQ